MTSTNGRLPLSRRPSDESLSLDGWRMPQSTLTPGLATAFACLRRRSWPWWLINQGISGPCSFVDGATTSDEDANFEGDSGSNNDEYPGSDNDSSCESDDEFSDEFSDEHSGGSDGETTMMWQSPIIEHSDTEGGCVGESVLWFALCCYACLSNLVPVNPLDERDNTDPISQLDSDEDMEPGEECLPTRVPDGFHLQESGPAALDQTLVKRYVLLRRGMGGLRERSAAECTRLLKMSTTSV